jgi:uncharacterized protein YlxW (UPF0749 family)
MTERMTDERLTKVSVAWKNPMTTLEIELLQALKAERERVEELEASAQSGYEDGWHKLRNERNELQSRIDELESALHKCVGAVIHTDSDRAVAEIVHKALGGE